MKKDLDKGTWGDLLVIYGKLLTKVIYKRMEAFYLDDLSYSEIANNERVSRTAIYDSIHEGEKSLLEFEEKLGLYKRLKLLRKLLKDYEDEKDEKSKEELFKKIKGEIEYGI